MQKELSTYIERYDLARNEYIKARNAFLREAFRRRKEYVIPEFLWGPMDEAYSGITTAWVDYRHDGAFVSIFGVRMETKHKMVQYLISGHENMEYSQDYVKDIETYDSDEVAYFIKEFISNKWDETLSKISRAILDAKGEGRDMEEAIENAISEHADLNLSDDLDERAIEDIIEWAEGYEAPVIPEPAVIPQDVQDTVSNLRYLAKVMGGEHEVVTTGNPPVLAPETIILKKSGVTRFAGSSFEEDFTWDEVAADPDLLEVITDAVREQGHNI